MMYKCMENFTLKTNDLRKFSQMTAIELRQAINNLSRNNANGQYNQRISDYRSQLSHVENQVVKKGEIFSASPLEAAAIMKFNADKRFKITE